MDECAHEVTVNCAACIPSLDGTVWGPFVFLGHGQRDRATLGRNVSGVETGDGRLGFEVVEFWIVRSCQFGRFIVALCMYGVRWRWCSGLMSWDGVVVRVRIDLKVWKNVEVGSKAGCTGWKSISRY